MCTYRADCPCKSSSISILIMVKLEHSSPNAGLILTLRVSLGGPESSSLDVTSTKGTTRWRSGNFLPAWQQIPVTLTSSLFVDILKRGAWKKDLIAWKEIKNLNRGFEFKISHQDGQGLRYLIRIKEIKNTEVKRLCYIYCFNYSTSIMLSVRDVYSLEPINNLPTETNCLNYHLNRLIMTSYMHHTRFYVHATWQVLQRAMIWMKMTLMMRRSGSKQLFFMCQTSTGWTQAVNKAGTVRNAVLVNDGTYHHSRYVFVNSWSKQECFLGMVSRNDS
jgi:hypothetical protein